MSMPSSMLLKTRSGSSILLASRGSKLSILPEERERRSTEKFESKKTLGVLKLESEDQGVVATSEEEGEARISRPRLQGFLSSLFAGIGVVIGEVQGMATRGAAQVPLQKQEVEKPKNVMGEARNRRALQDIGNVGKERAAKGKPVANVSRPVTRSLAAQALAKPQAPAEKKKPIAAAVNSKVPDAINTSSDESKLSPDVIDISSDESKLSTRKGLKQGSRKKVFSAVLSARSKAADGLSDKLKEMSVEDIDGEDAKNELAVFEYVGDLYKFYKEAEGDGRVHDYIDSQPDINDKMRMILIDWLVEVHRKFELNPETLYLTINIVDRFLSMRTVSRKELQLVGISSMLIASKYEEIWAPEVNDFVYISDNAYAREQVLVMEKSILERLEWYLTVPTPYVFLVRYIKASTPSDKEMESMVMFFAELGVMHYPIIVLYSSSMIAAAAVYAARCTLGKVPSWTQTLKHYTGYSEEQVIDCAKMLVCFHSGAAESKLKAVQRKYSSPDHAAVALFPPANSLLEQ